MSIPSVLNGKRAVICGASKGIGKSVAIRLAEAGMDTLLLARSEDELKATVEELDTLKGQAHRYLVVDFNNPDGVRKQIEPLLSESSPYHVLINNTGGPRPGLLHESSLNDLAQAFTMHVLVSQMLATLLIPGMKAARYGRIVNVISTSVKQPIDGLGVSNTIRGAMANWSKTMANELGQYGITVNNVLPGFTATQRLQEIIDLKSVTAGVEQDVMAQKMMRTVPVNRFAEPQELAEAVAFLCDASGGYISGINMPVDGGRTKSL